MAKRRTDGNQKEVVAALRKIGCSVFHTHKVGHGFVDIVCGFRGRNYLLEIKDGLQPPSRKKLTTDEKLFHFGWQGQVAIVYSAEDAVKYIQSKIYLEP
mgnify:CR=1 FL=1